MSIANVVEQYFAAIKNKDIDGLLSLYADNANVMLPNGKEIKGLTAIGEMQRMVFASAAPSPTVVNLVLAESSAAAEIEGVLSDGSIRKTANFYQLRADDKIVRLSVYMRS